MRISDWSSDVCSSDLLASPSEHRFENRRGRQEDLSTPEFVDNNPCHLARADDGLRDRDRKGHDFTKRLAIESPEPVRSSDIDEMLAAGLVPMGIVGKSFRRDAELPAQIGQHRAGRELARFQSGARPYP